MTYRYMVTNHYYFYGLVVKQRSNYISSLSSNVIRFDGTIITTVVFVWCLFIMAINNNNVNVL